MDVSDFVALLAVQGPRAVGLVSGMCADDVAALPAAFHAADLTGAGSTGVGIAGRDIPARTDSSSTSPPLDAPVLWDALLQAGA